jgi:hypothetical protein
VRYAAPCYGRAPFGEFGGSMKFGVVPFAAACSGEARGLVHASNPGSGIWWSHLEAGRFGFQGSWVNCWAIVGATAPSPRPGRK